jgi:hypothetical protein
MERNVRAADLANAFGDIVGGREDLVALLIEEEMTDPRLYQAIARFGFSAAPRSSGRSHLGI